MDEKRILIVDDEEEIRELLYYNLKKAGFDPVSEESGEGAISYLMDNHVDLILLDVMMPGMDGIETCNKIREMARHKQTLICFLTARNEDYSQIAGFDAGADDYIPKPIKPRVLVSRITALLRRAKSANDSSSSSRLNIDRDRYLVELDGVEVHLPRKEFELLALLASKPGHVFDRDIILNTVWGADIVVGDRTIDVHIRKLREKIGSSFIKTVKGVGYKFVLEEA